MGNSVSSETSKENIITPIEEKEEEKIEEKIEEKKEKIEEVPVSLDKYVVIYSNDKKYKINLFRTEEHSHYITILSTLALREILNDLVKNRTNSILSIKEKELLPLALSYYSDIEMFMDTKPYASNYIVEFNCSFFDNSKNIVQHMDFYRHSNISIREHISIENLCNCANIGLDCYLTDVLLNLFDQVNQVNQTDEEPKYILTAEVVD